MSVQGKMIEITISGGTASGYYVELGGGKKPGLIVIHEWWGLNEQIKEVAVRFAEQGFAVIAPDLYQGVQATDPTQAGKLMQSLSQQYARQVLDGAVEYLQAQDEVNHQKIGVTGFCMGGSYALLLACHHKAIQAAAPFYGDIPPDEVLNELSAPLLFIGAENDFWITQEKMQGLKASLERLKKEGEVKVYEGVGHAFFNNQRPDAYDEEAATDAWEQVNKFFDSHLR